MRTLSQEPKIIAMANALRLRGADHVEGIISFCRSKIAGWLASYGPAQTIWDVERIVCGQLNLVIHDVWNDNDLDGLIDTYVADGDVVFAHLRADLDEKTFATLICRKRRPHQSENSYVAVIDCRGKKGSRRFFSRWHEIAHLLTLYRQMELPLHRSTTEKNPIESLMDIIAGDVGFYDPMFRPLFDRELQTAGRLTFGVVENVRGQFCPEASFQATLNVCVARTPSPVVLLDVGMGLKKSELREVHSRQIALFPRTPPVPKLRVLSSMPNPAARQRGFQIPRFMRVPKNSIVSNAFNADSGLSDGRAEGTENLTSWVSSDGSRLPNMTVFVQATKLGDHVFAIINPIAV